MEFVSFQAIVAGGAPTAETCPQTPGAQPLCPYTPSGAGLSPSPSPGPALALATWVGLPPDSSCHPALPRPPAPPLTPRLLAVWLALRIARAPSLQMYNTRQTYRLSCRLPNPLVLTVTCARNAGASTKTEQYRSACLNLPTAPGPSPGPAPLSHSSCAQGSQAEVRPASAPRAQGTSATAVGSQQT